MKKKIFTYIFIILSLSFVCPTTSIALARTGYVTSSTQNTVIRKTPTADYANDNAVKDTDGTNAVVKARGTINIEAIADESPIVSACSSNKWYKMNYNNFEGYVCSDYITLNNDDPDIKETPTLTGNLVNDYNLVAYATHSTEGRVAIVEPKSGNDSLGCSQYRMINDYKVSCVDSSKLSNIQSVSVLNSPNYNFEEELNKFPESYRDSLKFVHSKHPNWKFYAYNTGLDWNTAVSIEKNSGLIQYKKNKLNNESYLDTYEGANYDWQNQNFIAHEGSEFFAPSKAIVSYYMDPRTYMKLEDLGSDGFDFRHIFAFEDSRAYAYQSDGPINKMLHYGGVDGTFTASNGNSISYNQAFTDGATFSKISPLTLIARSRIETKKFTSNSVSGTYGSYSGYYNYYNIGAFGSAPVTAGLQYAQRVGWNDRYKAITEGSIFNGTKYIYNGQETQYFQKFNVSPYSLNSRYGHQYQTNIQAPITEGTFVFWGYKDSGNIDLPIVFHIPVYDNMPVNPVAMPKNGNPNNWLKSLTINNNSLSGFDGDNYYSSEDNWDGQDDNVFPSNIYKYNMNWNETSINVSATAVSSSSSISGTGDIKITNTTDKPIVKDIDVVVTAENGTKKTYKIQITKQPTPKTDEKGNPIYPDINTVLNGIAVKYNSDYMSGLGFGTSHQSLIDTISSKNNGLVNTKISKNSSNGTNYLSTGDTITITSGSQNKTYTYVLYGDINGDGFINLSDLVDCRNAILGNNNLSGARWKASDVNKNGKIDLGDLVSIRNNILGTPISQ